ncbi:MAG: hypothetical protein EXR67_03060 [Dehalococcoidia bacterium]|nr:hypothetical protein [Dehalococcoidia bacterium]
MATSKRPKSNKPGLGAPLPQRQGISIVRAGQFAPGTSGTVIPAKDMYCAKSPTKRHWLVLPEAGFGPQEAVLAGVCKYCGHQRQYQRPDATLFKWSDTTPDEFRQPSQKDGDQTEE